MELEWDMILLDVDNGPGWLAAPGNAALYDQDGLAAARAALRPSGVLAIWSPGVNRELEGVLDRLFGKVERVGTEAFSRPEREPSNVIYLCQAPADVAMR